MSYCKNENETLLEAQKLMQRLSLNSLDAIGNYIPAGVIVIDDKARIIYANERAIEIFGFNPCGLGFKEYALNMAKARKIENGPYLYEQLPLIKALFYRQTTHGQEIAIEKPDGTQRFLSANATPLTDKEGCIAGALAIFEDVTERKKAEKAVKDNEKLYRTLFENSKDGFQLIELIYDKNNKPIDFRYLRINETYEKITGVKASCLIGKKARDVFPNYEPKWLETPYEVIKTGIPAHFDAYTRTVNKWLDMYYFPYSKNIVGTVFRDITEKKNLEKQMQEKEKLATIGATAGMVGHDIRNPLQAITSDVYLLKDSLTSMPDMPMKKDVAESLDSIERNVEYINKIVQDLQDYTRILTPQKVTFKVEDVCKEALYKKAIPQNVTATCVVQEEVKELCSDPAFLKRILTNLVNNAVQAMPHGGEIIIQVRRKANNVIITVKDTGVGIPEDNKSKMFTPLFTTKSKGQGFGLAIVKRMTEALGGTVTFESQENKGTKFIIKIPSK